MTTDAPRAHHGGRVAYDMKDIEIRKETEHYATLGSPVIEQMTRSQAHDFFEWLFSQGFRYIGAGPPGCIICEKIKGPGDNGYGVVTDHDLN